MNLGEFYQKVESYDILIIIYSIAIILIAVILGFISGKEKEKLSPWNYIYSVVIYSITVPGILQAIITGYLLFIEKKSLMDINLAVYIAPIASMIITLVIVSKNVDLKSIPGFDRLSGLMMMIGMSIILVIIISKTNIWLFFGGSMFMFFGLIIVIFLLIKLGAKKFLRKE
jgi:hypothetical protein